MKRKKSKMYHLFYSRVIKRLRYTKVEEYKSNHRDVSSPLHTLKYRIKGAHRITCAHLYFGEKNIMGN